jgi:dienelactone hydrolase
VAAKVRAQGGVPDDSVVADYHTPMYRPEQAMDGWEKVFGFFSRHLSS